MTVKDCYASIGGDYEGVLGRFRSEERIQRFALKFLTDSSFHDLCQFLRRRTIQRRFVPRTP